VIYLPRSKIGVSTVKHLAWLTRIDLTDKEAREISKQLSRILEYFSKIDEVDTSGVEPLYHPLEMQRVARGDEPAPFLADEILKIAPSRKGRYIKAPRIV
jgi:aspartyl-tRNA(Asn)/glutamyl-tRNA(Gln) amidotransferase subunit C